MTVVSIAMLAAGIAASVILASPRKQTNFPREFLPSCAIIRAAVAVSLTGKTGGVSHGKFQ